MLWHIKFQNTVIVGGLCSKHDCFHLSDVKCSWFLKELTKFAKEMSSPIMYAIYMYQRDQAIKSKKISFTSSQSFFLVRDLLLHLLGIKCFPMMFLNLATKFWRRK